MSLRALYCPLPLHILSSRGQEQLLVCSMLLQHIVPVWGAGLCDFCWRRRASAGNEQPGGPEARVLYGSLGEN